MKCKIVNGKKICRKSYNPFKMWQSYVGAGIGIFLFIYMNYMDCIGSGLNLDCNSIEALLYPGFFIGLFVGFLLGYVLTLIWRKIRK